MTDRKTTTRKDRWSTDQSRLYAVRMLLCACKRPRFDENDVLDPDEAFAGVMGSRAHARLCTELKQASGAGAAKEADITFASFFRGQRQPGSYITTLKKHLRELEQKLIRKKSFRGNHLSDNVARLAGLVGLNSTETRVLKLMVLLDNDAHLAEVATGYPGGSELYFCKNLAFVTGSQLRHVQLALRTGSTLDATALLRRSDTDHRGNQGRNIGSTVDLDNFKLMPGLCEQLLRDDFCFETAFSPCFYHAEESELGMPDFDYLGDPVQVLFATLRGAVRSRTKGVQVLLAGAPGVGKTELAKAIAKTLGLPLYAVANGGRSGHAYDRDERFLAFRAAQYVLGRRGKALILFDEVEDVFLDHVSPLTHLSRQKGWTNNLLESNVLPSIWITNTTDNIDPAHLRRFTFVLEMKVPPVAVRCETAQRYLGDYQVGADLLGKVARNPHFTPADLARAGQVLNLAKDEAGRVPNPPRMLATVLGQLPQGPDAAELLGENLMPLPEFDPALINTDLDISQLIAGLRRSRAGRLCLYGLPGTGKTAFAQHLAEQLEKELVTVSASSWLNCYLGNTEKNIQASFENVAQNDAILFVDEADSFLRDRRLAKNSWEVTQVNELLKRLEQARGVVIFATNNFEALDTAVLRRLDIKAEFRPLNDTQVAAMFGLTLNCEPGTHERDALYSAALRLKNVRNELVNGDFIAARRSLYVSGQPLTAPNLARALEKEVDARLPGRQSRVGFTATID